MRVLQSVDSDDPEARKDAIWVIVITVIVIAQCVLQLTHEQGQWTSKNTRKV